MDALALKIAARFEAVLAPKWDKGRVKRWMQQHVDEYVDRRTGEVNATEMAEAAANEFDIYEDRQDYRIPEDIFDISADVAEAAERRLR